MNLRTGAITKRLRQFGPRVLFHATGDLNVILREDEISGSQGVQLTSFPQRALRGAWDVGPSPGIIVFDRDRLEELELITPVVDGGSDMHAEVIYPVSASAVGLFRLRDDPQAFATQSFGLQFVCQMEAMQRYYRARDVRQEDIEPFQQLTAAMAAHFRQRYNQDTFSGRAVEVLVSHYTSARAWLEQIESETGADAE